MKHLPRDVPHIPSPDNCFVVNYQANLAAADISHRHLSHSPCLRARRTPLSALSLAFSDLVFSFLIQHYIVIIICLQYDVSDCWEIKSCLVVLSLQRGTLWKTFIYHNIIYGYFCAPRGSKYSLVCWRNSDWWLCRMYVKSKSITFYAQHQNLPFIGMSLCENPLV